MATATLTIREFDFATFTAEVTLNVDTVYVDQWVQPILQMRVLSNGRIPVPNLILPYFFNGFPLGRFLHIQISGRPTKTDMQNLHCPCTLGQQPGHIALAWCLLGKTLSASY
ncbi:MAG: hypothetical protein IPP40_18035 [bacterium]|nr:hypothetical protein [bacterium]